MPLADIVSLSEVRWFNGTRLWWKRGFVLETTGGQRVGLAIPEPYARDWRARLSRGSLPANGKQPEPKPPAQPPGKGSPTSRAMALGFCCAGLLWLALWSYIVHRHDRPSTLLANVIGFAALELSALVCAIRASRVSQRSFSHKTRDGSCPPRRRGR